MIVCIELDSQKSNFHREKSFNRFIDKDFHNLNYFSVQFFTRNLVEPKHLVINSQAQSLNESVISFLLAISLNGKCVFHCQLFYSEKWQLTVKNGIDSEKWHWQWKMSNVIFHCQRKTWQELVQFVNKLIFDRKFNGELIYTYLQYFQKWHFLQEIFFMSREFSISIKIRL